NRIKAHLNAKHGEGKPHLTPRIRSMSEHRPVSWYLACAALLSSLGPSLAAAPAASPPAVPNAAPAATPAPPAPPGSVESTPLSPTAIRIYWSAPPGVVSGYRILRDGRPIAEVAPEARAFDDLGLQPGRNYRYRIVALLRGEGR